VCVHIANIDIEWLCLGVGAASRCWVSEVTQSHESGQICYSCSIVEDLCCHAVSLALVDSAARGACCDSAGILSTVL
jgi:hypothetical protein